MNNAIVIPCYNESSRLDFDQYSAFLKKRPNYIFCFVNDGSNDNTLEYLNAFQSQHAEQVKVLDLKQNRGKAEAVRAGMNHLIWKNELTSIGFMDADLSTGFDEYQNLVNKLTKGSQSKEMIFGSRKINNESKVERSGFRKFASAIAGGMIKSVLRMSIEDTQCGAKVFTPNLARIVFRQTFISRWLFDVELFIRMKRRFGKQEIWTKMEEVPLKKWVHVEGSKITLKDSLNLPTQLGKIVLAYHLNPYLRVSGHKIRGFSHQFVQSLNLL